MIDFKTIEEHLSEIKAIADHAGMEKISRLTSFIQCELDQAKGFKFTPEQVDFICYQIGEWYLKWKHNIGQNIGRAKEDLKVMICDDAPPAGTSLELNELIAKKFMERVRLCGCGGNNAD